jgi:hypothetical protein
LEWTDLLLALCSRLVPIKLLSCCFNWICVLGEFWFIVHAARQSSVKEPQDLLFCKGDID